MNRLLNKPDKDVPYNDKAVFQDHDAQLNSSLPEIDVDKIYNIPLFKFFAASLL